MTQDPQSARMPEEYEHWFFTARDPEKSMPYGTHMLYRVCNGDPDKFQIAEDIMRIAFEAGMNARADLAIPKDKLQGWIEAMEYIQQANLNGLNSVKDKADQCASEMREMVK
jgi:hypothetical protein